MTTFERLQSHHRNIHVGRASHVATVAIDRPKSKRGCRPQPGGIDDRRDALEVEALAQSVNTNTDDLREALTAFVERQPPNFTGR